MSTSNNSPNYRFNDNVLTPAQTRVISLSLHGLAQKEIAAILGNSPNTINSHFSNIYRELRINDCKLLVGWAYDNKFDRQGCINGIYLFDGYENLPWHKKK